MKPTNEMVEHYTLRTRAHLYLVWKWSDRIKNLNHPKVDKWELDLEKEVHDCGKWLEPEYTPYVFISWRYREKRYGREFEVPKEISDKMHEATFSHIKKHKHHPEYWDDKATIDYLNHQNRDKPSEHQTDATKMPLTYVAAMVADWLAMSEELETCPYEWIKNNVNIRWRFTDEQADLINKLVEALWVKEQL